MGKADRRNRGAYFRRKEIADIVIRERHTTVAAIAREVDSTDRQIRNDIKAIKDEYNIDMEPGRYGGVKWHGGVFLELESYRKELQDYLIVTVGEADAASLVRIIQELSYSSQKKAYRVLVRLKGGAGS